jgi:hypothetical protein
MCVCVFMPFMCLFCYFSYVCQHSCICIAILPSLPPIQAPPLPPPPPLLPRAPLLRRSTRSPRVSHFSQSVLSRAADVGFQMTQREHLFCRRHAHVLIPSGPCHSVDPPLFLSIPLSSPPKRFPRKFGPKQVQLIGGDGYRAVRHRPPGWRWGWGWGRGGSTTIISRFAATATATVVPFGTRHRRHRSCGV